MSTRIYDSWLRTRTDTATAAKKRTPNHTVRSLWCEYCSSCGYIYENRSTRWRIKLSSSLWYRSVSWVRAPPSAYSYKFVETFSCAQIDMYVVRKTREREIATNTGWKIDEQWDCWALIAMRDKNWRQEPGERRDDTCDHVLSRSWKVEVWEKNK